MKFLVDQCIKLYVQLSKKNDFAIVHTVTAFWALKQISEVTSKADLYEAIASLLCGVCGMYMAIGCPDIHDEKIQIDPLTTTWENMRKELLAVPVDKVDEHDFKLFQVCLDQYNATDCENTKMMYLKAVRNNLDFPFEFLNR